MNIRNSRGVAAFLISFATFVGVSEARGACSQNRITIVKNSGDNGKWIDGKNFAYAPGDTLVLKAANNPYSYIALANFHGTAACPITITNEGGQVQLTNGFNFESMTYVKLDGSGTSGVNYGFRISDPANIGGPGVDINHKSAHIEVKNIQVDHKLYGIVAKQDPVCDPSFNYPNWTFDDIHIHHNLISDVNQEGMYLGNTAPNGIGRTITCDGVVSSPIPARLSNINVHDNTVENTRRAGIQFSGGNGINGQGGTNWIVHNYVRNTGLEENGTQGPGISLGGDSYANVCGNFVTHTWNLGIYLGGSGLSRVENNIVEYSGYTDNGIVHDGMAAISATSLVTLPSQYANRVYIRGNQLSATYTDDYAIRFNRGTGTYTTSYICGTTPTGSPMKFDTGVPYSLNCPAETSPCASIAAITSPPAPTPKPSPSPTPSPKPSPSPTPSPKPSPTSIAYGGTPASLPGKIQAEKYDTGGAGVSYSDTTAGNTGGAFRKDDVDIQKNGSDTFIGWIAPGEWTRYSVNAQKGAYTLKVRVASPYSGKSMTVKFNGQVIATVKVPNTGSYLTFKTVTVKNVVISGGKHLMRVDFVTDGFNLDSLAFSLP